MFINNIFVAVALAASAVVAAPAELSVKRQDPNEENVKLCLDADFNRCTELPYILNICTTLWDNMAQTRQLNDQVTSFDTYSFECTFYIDTECRAASGSFPWQGGQRDLADSDLKYADNAISSFSCKRV
ncbi:hypothetical protein LZ554_003964 [Drepanopeziza brunnea f. sp. 'monogermtubi']|nr:hypothetical protein LZ554_003964 [Drepanopeziza brunnea f. sp. 'monogermtubi']